MTALDNRILSVRIRWVVLALIGNAFFSLSKAADDPIPLNVQKSEKSQSENATDTVIWRADRVCGLNCLYMLLRCAGATPDYKRMEELLVTEPLSSLHDIQQVAKSYGCDLVLRKLNPSSLKAAAKPVIAHLDVVTFDGKAAGHFILVIDTSESGVQYIDGTTVETLQASWRDFERSWSGHAAFRKSDQLPSALAMTLAAGFGATFGLVCSFLICQRRLCGQRLKAQGRVQYC